MKIFQTEDGKKWIADYKHDTKLYEAPVNPPDTGTRYTRGTDLLAHKTKSGAVFFYKYNWSMWQGEESNYEPVSREEAEKFLVQVTGDYHGFPRAADLAKLKEFGFDLADETA